MASSKFGRKLNPYRCLREPLGVKGVRQSVAITNNLSTIDQNQQLLVRFPNLGANDVIIPGTARLSFRITLVSGDANRTVVQNLGCAIVKKTVIKISDNEVMSVDDSDVFNCCGDLWKTLIHMITETQRGFASMQETKMRQSWPSATASTSRSISSCSRATCCSIKPRLETDWSTNSPSTTTAAQFGPQAMPTPKDIENRDDEIVTQPELARMIANQYNGRLAILYDRILRHRKISRDKSDTLWNINLNMPACSMTGVLMLFEDVAAQHPFARNTESFYNPKITKVEVTIEGIPNQLFSQGMQAYQMWDEARKLFAASPSRKSHPEVAVVAKDLCLADVSLWEFLTSVRSVA